MFKQKHPSLDPSTKQLTFLNKFCFLTIHVDYKLEISSIHANTCQINFYFAPFEVDSANNFTLIRLKPRQPNERKREREKNLLHLRYFDRYLAIGTSDKCDGRPTWRRNTELQTVWRTKLNWNANRDTTRESTSPYVVTSCAGGLPTLLRPGSPPVCLSCHWCAI